MINNIPDIPIAKAKLPASYLAAKEMLRVAAKHFTPETYAMATLALQRCAETDEMATWPDLPNSPETMAETMASYARIADDKQR